VHRFLTYTLCYVGWVTSLVLGFYALVTVREAGLATLAVLAVEPGLAALVDKLGFFAMGLAGLAVTIVSEAYLRRGLHTGHLLGRLAFTMGIEMLVLFACHTWLRLAPGLAEAVRPGLVHVSGELAVGLLGMRLGRSR